MRGEDFPVPPGAENYPLRARRLLASQPRHNGGGGEEFLKQEAQPSSRPFTRIINPVEWEGEPVPERKWTVPDYIPHATVTLMTGDGGKGKSLLALQLAIARALARDWIGLLPAPGRTLVLSTEDDTDETHRRTNDILKLYRARMADLGDMRLVDLVGKDSVLGELWKGRIEPTELYRTLDAFMAQFKPSLTILDVLAEMFAGEENKRAQADNLSIS